MTKYLQMKAQTLLLALDLQYFAEGDEDPNGGGEIPPPAPEEQQQEEKTFTQTELNKMIAKEKKTAQENFLKSAGFTDFENAKDGIQKFKEWQESQRTDAENKAIELENANKTLAEVNAEKATLAAELAAFKAGAKAESLGDVILLAQAKVSDDVTIDDAIKQVLETYPQFKGEQEQEKPPAPPQYSPGNPNPPGGNKEMTRDSFAKMSYAKRVEFQQANPVAFKKLFE